MSNIGMERNQRPTFWLEDDETGGPCFWWNNPYNGKREKIAALFWPQHPVEATEAVEHLFESLELRAKNPDNYVSCSKCGTRWLANEPLPCPTCNPAAPPPANDELRTMAHDYLMRRDNRFHHETYMPDAREELLVLLAQVAARAKINGLREAHAIAADEFELDQHNEGHPEFFAKYGCVDVDDAIAKRIKELERGAELQKAVTG